LCHALLRDARLWSFLRVVDADLARESKLAGCRRCGAPLHSARYRRKPRGPASLPEDSWYRLSFCCSEDGCRARLTPPSVLFLGRKVFLMAVVVLVTAMRQGPTPSGLRELEHLMGADRRTLGRWQTWWEEFFPRTPFWNSAKAHFDPGLVSGVLPLALFSHFHAGVSLQSFLELLKFLSPFSTGPPAAATI
jgi:hypothetical protein